VKSYICLEWKFHAGNGGIIILFELAMEEKLWPKTYSGVDKKE